MRKDEHLKIVGEFEATIKELKEEILDLRKITSKSDFEARLSKLIADQRLDMVHDVMSKNITSLKNMKHYDKQVQDYYNQSMARITLDDMKFNTLKNFIKHTFPNAVVEMKPNSPLPPEIVDEKLSNTFIGENGEIFVPQHIIDIAILIMNKQRDQLKEMLGDGYFDNDEFED
jgi:hypothetical protein